MPGRRNRGFARVFQQIGRLVFHLVFRLRVRGADRVPATGPVLLAGNHAGFLDGPLVFVTAPRPASFLTKAEMFVGPLGHLLGWIGQIPVRRGRPDRAALRGGLGVLEAGGVLGVFPEGTRGSGEFDQVQHGIAYLALHAGCPIVPVASHGTQQALPQGSWRPRWRAPVEVVFGEPFTVTASGDLRARRALALAAEDIRARLVTHLNLVRGER